MPQARSARHRRQELRRRPQRRPARSPVRLTDWGQSVVALTVTLLVLASWSVVARGSDVHTPRALADEGVRADEAPVRPEDAPVRPKDAPPRAFSLAAAGDVLIHGPVATRAAANATDGADHDFRPMFAQVAPLLEDADLAICHMETPISADNSDVSSYPTFNAPTEIAQALVDSGFDLCSTASNHAYDQGSLGIRMTLSVLRDVGLRAEGTAGNPDEAEQPELIDVNGVRVGHLSYTYGLNGFSLPPSLEYLVDLLKVKQVLSDAEHATEMGAEFVVLSLQWGQEFQTEVTPGQMGMARRLLRSPDIDLIVGHHVHVPQAIKEFDGEYAIFGLGNLISNQRPDATSECCPPETQDGLVVRVDVHEGADRWKTSVTYWPTWVRPTTFEVLPVALALDDPAYAGDRAALEESWRRTVATVDSLGAGKSGVVPAERP